MKSFAKQAIIGVIVLLVVGFFLRSQYSIKTAKENIQSLKEQVDSLRKISSNYTLLKLSYDSLYANMEGSKRKLTELQEKINTLSVSQISSLKTIKSELTLIAKDLDSLNSIPTIKPTTLDSLRF